MRRASSCATCATTRCSGRTPAWYSARSTTRPERQTAARPRRVLRPGPERARSHDHRVRAYDRQRHPRGVLVQVMRCCDHRLPSDKQISVRQRRSALSAAGRRRRREVGARARVRGAGRGRAARLQRRAHPRRRHDDRRQAGRGRRVARRRRADAADDGAAARRHRAAGRDAARAQARERGGDARARRARSAAEASPSRRRRSCSWPAVARQAQPHVQAARASTRRSSSAACIETWPTPSGGCRTAWRPPGMEIEPAGARLLAERVRHRRQAPAQRCRSAAAVRARADDHRRSTTSARSSARRRCRTTGR